MKPWQQKYETEQTAIEVIDPGHKTTPAPPVWCGDRARCTRPAGHDGKHQHADKRGGPFDSWWNPGPHPTQFSPEVLDVLRNLIRPGERVHDPYAGPGVRLAQLCDELGAAFSGADIEKWTNPPRDRRVVTADARDPAGYPQGLSTIVTSPVYFNVRCCDYPDGPTVRTKMKGRRDYAIALGQPLHPGNLARTTGRPAHEDEYWQGHGEAVAHWGDRVIVNVDEPISETWQSVLVDHGYTISQVIPAYTQRYGGLDNAGDRAEFEVVIVATRA